MENEYKNGSKKLPYRTTGKKRSMKRWLANLFIVILLLSLTGCISYKENNKETERDTIVISVLAGQSTSDAGVEDLVDEWME